LHRLQKGFHVEKGTKTNLLVGTTLAFLLGGCHSGNSSTSPTLPAVTPAAGTVATAVVDDATGLPIASSLTIYNQSGTAVNGPTVNANGVFTYVLPSAPTSTVNYTLVASATGYNTSSLLLQVPPPSAAAVAAGSYLVPATMRLSAQTATTVPGVTTVPPTTVTLGTAISTSAAGTPGASILIPTGTTIDNALGNPVSGAVKLTTTYYSNASSSSMAAIPSGSQIILGGTPTTLISGGGVSANLLDSNGNAIPGATFSSPVTLTIDIPATTINPAITPSRPVQQGDTIPVYYIGANGLPAALGVNATLGAQYPAAPAAAQYYPSTFTTSHFCFFDAAWSLPAAATSNPTITITGAGGKAVSGLVALSSGGWANAFALTGQDPDPVTVTLQDVPADASCTVTLTALGATVGTATFNSGTTAVPGTASITVANYPATTSITITTSGQCTNGIGTVPLASTFVTAICASPVSLIQGVTDLTGTVTLKGLLSGVTYDISAVPASGLTPLTNNVAIAAGSNATSFTFPITCNGNTGVTGAGN